MTPIDCPVCRAPFREVLMDGVLVDICTRCSGVWLDRGELERLLRSRPGEGADKTRTAQGR